MNADEIVRALRICNNPKGHRCSVCPIFSRYEHRTCKATVDKAAAALIESLQAQLAESQRRADAAVADLKKLDRREPFGGRNCANKSECYEENRKIGGNYPECDNCTEWQWRGPVAGEGETE